MRLGIDFGTTRIVVAAEDRGNYPVAAFECPDGASREWIPPLVAVGGGERLYGWDAWAAQGLEGVIAVRSIKRALSECGPETRLELGGQAVPVLQILTELLVSVRSAITDRSTLGIKPGERLEVVLGVPANANSNQRFLTVEAFRAAGFEILGLLNEPSAASVESSHRLGGAKPGERILVYDLGGGTFDASLVVREEDSHAVEATEGIPTLGGDDFDEVLAELAFELSGLPHERTSLTQNEEFLLAEECREKKESLHPNTRRLMLDLDRVRPGWPQVAVPVADYYARLAPLVEETLDATAELLARTGAEHAVTLYVTGGASELPLVGRCLRERFGRRVKRSAYTRASTAIGLAIQAGAQSPYKLRDRFTRHFGVWREGEEGRRMIFDALFEKGAELPAPEAAPLERIRLYSPAHNIGHFRYLECSRRGAGGEPSGDIAAWDEIRFPFDPALAGLASLDAIAVERGAGAAAQWIEERYTAEATGAVRVRIANLTSGYSREYRLGRWAAEQKTLKHPRPPRAARKRSASQA